MIDRGKLIDEIKFKKKLNVNDYFRINESWNKCADIMAENEEDTIQFIKDNYNNDEYGRYLAELIEPYFEKTKSKRFIMEIWEFFKNIDDKNAKDTYVNWTESIIYDNYWEDEEWV